MVVNSRVVARIEFSVAGQGSTPKSATIHSAIRWRALKKQYGNKRFSRT